MNDIKLRNLIETFADAFYTRLQYASQDFIMGFTERRATIRYNDVPFEVKEISGADMTTGDYINSMSIEVPRNIMKEGGLSVAWRIGYGHSRTDDIDLRKRACYELAHRFVEEVLPKVDFEIEKVVYNRNIDKILSVLDGPSYDFQNETI